MSRYDVVALDSDGCTLSVDPDINGLRQAGVSAYGYLSDLEFVDAGLYKVEIRAASHDHSGKCILDYFLTNFRRPVKSPRKCAHPAGCDMIAADGDIYCDGCATDPHLHDGTYDSDTL